MLRRILVVLGLLTAFASVASAQTVDDIIAKCNAARGGLDKIKAINTIRLTGKMTVGPGFEAPVVMLEKRPNQSKMSFTLQGMTGIQAYDGKVGWAVMPFMGKKDPEQMSADDVKEIGLIETQPLLEGRNMTMVLSNSVSVPRTVRLPVVLISR